MRVQFHPAAERELTEAAVYYEHRVPGLGVSIIAVAHKRRRPGYWQPRS